ncbi:hypothetical protein H6F67_06600 [Microcoleus sp. FACHB-1515]|uniref:type II toxin-antitoxin system RelN family antitoxin n=1 Tax=Cyanophyceae TaxID=3028117 RepID=UPI001685E0C8|nr:hypothetical protein [Microcoleus sp. FACHB-1515]MBD2089521.1 hypothetical protein [Microcoleus sp. FACHB-1515]
MRAIEVTGTIDAEGNLLLDAPIQAAASSRVRVILLFSEPAEETDDSDDTPVEEIKASLQQALQQAKSGDRIPLSEMWDGTDLE